MLAENGKAAFGQAKRVLQFGSHGQDFGYFATERYRLGCIPAGPPQNARLPFELACHRIVDAHKDVAIVIDNYVR